LPGFDVIEDNVLSENDVMFYGMNGNVIDTLIAIAHFHAVSVFLYDSKGSFNPRPERFKLLVDDVVR